MASTDTASDVPSLQESGDALRRAAKSTREYWAFLGASWLAIAVCIGVALVIWPPLALIATALCLQLVCQHIWIPRPRRGLFHGLIVDGDRAPALHSLVREVAVLLDVRAPQIVSIVAGGTVTVDRIGRGRRRLQIGYELLAVATESELRALVAHAIALDAAMNGKAVDRIFRRMEIMAAHVVRLERGRTASEAADNRLTRWLMERIGGFGSAAESSLTEYLCAAVLHADADAARLFGGDRVYSAIVREHILAVKTRGLHWRDFVVHCGLGDVVEWARKPLSAANPEEEEKLLTVRPDGLTGVRALYPPPAIRLSAVGGSSTACASDSAFSLVPDLSAMLSDLVAASETASAAEERILTIDMAKSADGQLAVRKSQLAGLLGAALGVVFLILVVLTMQYWSGALYGAACFALAGVCVWIWLRLRAPRRPLPLPPPRFEAFMDALEAGFPLESAEGWQDEMSATLAAGMPASPRRKGRLAYWHSVCRDAVIECDFHRAWVASGECLELFPRSQLGLLARGLSCAALGMSDGFAAPVDRSVSLYGSNRSVALGVGLLGAILGNWEYAEPYLLRAAGKRCSDPDILAVLAVCQDRMARPREAAARLRAALDLAPQDARIRLHLGDLLTTMGRPDEAVAALLAPGAPGPDDTRLMLLLVHANALMRRADEAEEWTCKLLGAHPDDASLYLRLGMAYLDAGLWSDARRYLESACERGFYPQAYVALARCAADEDDLQESRRLLMVAVDMTREPSEGGRSQTDVLRSILDGLLFIGSSPCECRAWVAQLSLNGASAGAGDAALQILIYAPDKTSACAYAQALQDAMFPDRVIYLAPIDLMDVDDEFQPSAAITPGIHDYRVLEPEETTTPDAASPDPPSNKVGKG